MAKDLTVTLTGDVFISYPEVCPPVSRTALAQKIKYNVVPIERKTRDLSKWLENVAPVLRQGTFTFCNLEGPICAFVSEEKASSFAFGEVVTRLWMPPVAAGILKDAGFSAVTTANNIVMNMGHEAMLETLKHLDAAGVGHAGSGHNLSEARKPVFLEKDGVRVAVLARSSVYTPHVYPAGENKPGVAPVEVSTAYQPPVNVFFNPGVPPNIITTPNQEHVEELFSQIRKAKAEADIVVVSWHWGATRVANAFGLGIMIDYSPFYVLDYQEKMAHAAIDAGADLIMGHHPHRLQGMEIYKGKLICYSLGNMVMSFGEGVNFGEESVIVKAHLDARTKKFTGYTLVPLIAPEKSGEPHIVPMDKAGRVLSELRRLSKKYGTRYEPGNEITVTAG